jgi:hypothetical protein
MLRKLRRKFASSISVIQGEEDFLYSNWLRIPPNDKVSVGEISSNLLDTSSITFNIEKPFSTELLFTFSKTTLYPEDLRYLFSKVGTNAVFFQLLYVPSKVISHQDIEPKPSGYSAKRFEFLLSKPPEWDIPVQFRLPKPAEYMFRFNTPEIKDYLYNLKPKVKKIDLLNQHDFFAGGEETATEEIDIKSFGKMKLKKINIGTVDKTPKLYKIKVPGMGKYKSKVSKVKLLPLNTTEVSKSRTLSFTQPSIVSPKFDFISTGSLKYFDTHETEIVFEPGLMNNELNEKEELSEVMKLLLKRTYKVEWAGRKDPDLVLSKFEEESAKFLVENNRALLAAEPGIDNIKEFLTALKFLYSNKVIFSSLIVLPVSSLGQEKNIRQPGSCLGWLGSLENYSPGLSYSVIKGDDDERTIAWKKSALVYLVDHETFLKDINLKILEKQRLAKFDCIIIDEAQDLLEKSADDKDLYKEISPNIFWALSGVVYDDILTTFNRALGAACKIEKKLVKRLTDIPTDYTGINHQEYWLEPDEHQKVEYKESLVDCRKELKRVLESGNPFRYQANIFMLLHKLFQVENFAHGYDTSPKSDLLLQHLRLIKRNDRKVIIVSQYDRQGTKKIERLLDRHKINYIAVPSSLSVDEMKKAVSLFKSRKSITAFLTNAKLSRIDFGDFIIPYIIRFDSWWNPALLWQTEELFDFSESSKELNRMNVFTYKMLNTIDEEINRILIRKNLIEDSVISVMTSNAINDLISVEEWLKIFELPVEDDTNKVKKKYDETIERLKNQSLADYRATLSRFFFTIGYSSIDILEHENSASFDISGEGKAGKQSVYLICRVLLEDFVSKKAIKQIIFDSSLAQKSNIFVITRGKFEKGSDQLARKNVTLLDVEKLAGYLVTLNVVETPATQSV